MIALIALFLCLLGSALLMLLAFFMNAAIDQQCEKHIHANGMADEVNAYLLADITHIAGLVAAGLHPSPIDHAHFTTTCTHKQMYGGRGGLIMIGKDYDKLIDSEAADMICPD